MNAEQYRDLALRAVEDAWPRITDPSWASRYLCVWENGQTFVRVNRPTGSVARNAVLSAPLNAETTASPYALARALLASRITVKRHGNGFEARFDNGEPSYWSFIETLARAALLDALLPAEAT